jgi:catechol 2,3-dioxygenase-like lactoylglutathione lyase family enzyme
MSLEIRSVVPILRMFDVAATKRFYVDYLGCTLDWHDGPEDEAAGPAYMQVSRAGLTLHLSSHHDDGTPGSAVLVHAGDVAALHAELRGRGYPFLNPGLEPGPGGGREMQLIDPASNRIRFFESAEPGVA